MFYAQFTPTKSDIASSRIDAYFSKKNFHQAIAYCLTFGKTRANIYIAVMSLSSA